LFRVLAPVAWARAAAAARGSWTAMANLVSKAGFLREQLGLPKAMPISEIVSSAVKQLGLEEEVGTLSLVQKVNVCCSALGLDEDKLEAIKSNKMGSSAPDPNCRTRIPSVVRDIFLVFLVASNIVNMVKALEISTFLSNQPISRPPPPPGGNVPCFPSYATLRKADGTVARIDALQEGDAVLASDRWGRLHYDTVSLFSLADPNTEATFLTLRTTDGVNLTLTPTHQLPVGPTCCATLKQAADVRLGDVVYAHTGDAQPFALVAQTVGAVDVTRGRGLHNPLLTHGGFPVIDGVATSFNSIRMVTLDAWAVPPLVALCKATGSCHALRRTLVSVECVYTRAVYGGARPCKAFKFIDGLETSEWVPTRSPAPEEEQETIPPPQRSARQCGSAALAA